MKATEIRDLTDEELDARLSASNRELFNLRMQKSTGQIENPIRLRMVRRDVARLRTVSNERRRIAE